MVWSIPAFQKANKIHCTSLYKGIIIILDWRVALISCVVMVVVMMVMIQAGKAANALVVVVPAEPSLDHQSAVVELILAMRPWKTQRRYIVWNRKAQSSSIWYRKFKIYSAKIKAADNAHQWCKSTKILVAMVYGHGKINLHQTIKIITLWKLKINVKKPFNKTHCKISKSLTGINRCWNTDAKNATFYLLC